jgi:hypothetical protein
LSKNTYIDNVDAARWRGIRGSSYGPSSRPESFNKYDFARSLCISVSGQAISAANEVGIRHDWVLVPFHLTEIISRLCCLVHLRIWNGTKERNTNTAA